MFSRCRIEGYMWDWLRLGMEFGALFTAPSLLISIKSLPILKDITNILTLLSNKQLYVFI